MKIFAYAGNSGLPGLSAWIQRWVGAGSAVLFGGLLVIILSGCARDAPYSSHTIAELIGDFRYPINKYRPIRSFAIVGGVDGFVKWPSHYIDGPTFEEWYADAVYFEHVCQREIIAAREQGVPPLGLIQIGVRVSSRRFAAMLEFFFHDSPRPLRDAWRDYLISRYGLCKETPLLIDLASERWPAIAGNGYVHCIVEYNEKRKPAPATHLRTEWLREPERLARRPELPRISHRYMREFKAKARKAEAELGIRYSKTPTGYEL